METPALYRDLLVHLKSYEAWSPHIDATIALAARTNARVTGLLTLQEIAIAKQLAGGPGGGGEFLGALKRDAEAKTQAIRERFEAALASAGVRGVFEWGEGRANELLSLVGRFHDLITVEQTDPAHDEANWLTAEEAAVHSGRPTLIVPRQGDFTRLGSKVLLAWNGSRESTRALHAAMPFIEAADSVVLLEGRPKEPAPSVTRFPAMDIAAYLEGRARVVQAVSRDLEDAAAGSVILDTVASHGCDLIVMGAYGRNGLSRIIFGGATRKVFRDTSVPILAAH